MHLDSPTLESYSTKDRNTVLACYAQALCMGHSLKCRQIQHSTVTAYIDAAALLFTQGPLGLADPTRRSNSTSRSPLLAKVLREHKRWESMPNLREPVTKSML